MNKDFYLDDYSTEDILKNICLNEDYSLNDIIENEKDTDDSKPTFSMKPNYNNKGEKVVVFSINIPFKKNGIKIDILINNEMYKNIGKHLK